jgi:hypothetical protein
LSERGLPIIGEFVGNASAEAADQAAFRLAFRKAGGDDDQDDADG